ncbi:N-acetylmuramoyl-L-alanine amidase [Streptomyces sp. JNUCC 64]
MSAPPPHQPDPSPDRPGPSGPPGASDQSVPSGPPDVSRAATPSGPPGPLAPAEPLLQPGPPGSPAPSEPPGPSPRQPEPSAPPAPQPPRSAVRRRAVLVGAAVTAAGLLAGLALTGGPSAADRGAATGTPTGTGTPATDRDTTVTPDGTAPERGTAARPGPAEDGGPSRSAPLAGRVVVIDPGHNPGNFDHPREIAREVDIGTGRKPCDATGTASEARGDRPAYREADFTLDVSRRLAALLRERGPRVVLTHDADRPWGPCVDERARIGNAARADAAVSLHADGAPSGERGFHVILPAKVRAGAADTARITGPSRRLGERIVRQFGRVTGTSPAGYAGDGTGLDVRGDLGGLNLSRVPKVFVECGNMRDARDAALLADPEWRERAARGVAEGIMSFLRG